MQNKTKQKKQLHIDPGLVALVFHSIVPSAQGRTTLVADITDIKWISIMY